MSGHRKKSRDAKSGEYGGCGIIAILFFARNCWVRTEVWDGALPWWSSQVCCRQSSGRRLRTFTRSRRKTSQHNPEFTVWPVATNSLCYHNCCIDGDTSPECFWYHPVYVLPPI
jgi:hypothetical protein